MRVIPFVRRHPIAVLSLFALAFIVWVWRDMVPGPAPAPQLTQVEVPTLPPPPFPQKRLFPVDGERPNPPPQGTVQAISKLKPGMTRTEVEGLVGIPAPQDIHPATIIDGRVTYHTTYEADLEPPPTVRPIRRFPRPPPSDLDQHPKARTLVVLEFDATKPGHPLIDVHYPDPLF
jgi:hypothetical protein